MNLAPGLFTRMAHILNAHKDQLRSSNQIPTSELEDTLKAASVISEHASQGIDSDALERELAEADMYRLINGRSAWIGVENPRMPGTGIDVKLNVSDAHQLVIDVYMLDPDGEYPSSAKRLRRVELPYSDFTPPAAPTKATPTEEVTEPPRVTPVEGGTERDYLVRRTIDEYQIITAESAAAAQHKALENPDSDWEWTGEDYEVEEAHVK